MTKEQEVCKHCAEYGSEFCKECLKEQEESAEQDSVDKEPQTNYK